MMAYDIVCRLLTLREEGAVRAAWFEYPHLRPSARSNEGGDMKQAMLDS